MKKQPWKTTTYYTEIDNFMMDIIEYPETDNSGNVKKVFDVWLYRYNSGVKCHVISEYKKDYPGMKTDDYAAHALEYCYHDFGAGNAFELYDELV